MGVTIPQLQETETPDDTMVMPVDTGIQTYKLKLLNLAQLVLSKIGLASDTEAGLASPTGNLTNSHVASGAAIAWSKLATTGQVVNASVAASAAIAGSKITPHFNQLVRVEYGGSNAQILLSRTDGANAGAGYIGANVNYAFMSISSAGTTLFFGVHRSGYAYAPFGINFGQHTLNNYQTYDSGWVDRVPSGGLAGYGATRVRLTRIGNTVTCQFSFVLQKNNTAGIPSYANIIPANYRPSVRTWHQGQVQYSASLGVGNQITSFYIDANGTMAIYANTSLAGMAANFVCCSPYFSNGAEEITFRWMI